MNAGDSILWCVLLILFIIVFVFLIEMFVPISKKVELNTLSRKFVITMENQGGLSEAQVDDLKNRLMDKAFSDIGIHAPKPNTVKFGEDLSLNVSVTYKHNRIKHIFLRTEENILMNYDIVTKSRRVIN